MLFLLSLLIAKLAENFDYSKRRRKKSHKGNSTNVCGFYANSLMFCEETINLSGYYSLVLFFPDKTDMFDFFYLFIRMKLSLAK